MARQVIVQLTDDIDGGEATATVSFSVGTKSYEIDLNEKNAKALDSALAKYVTAARPGSTKVGIAKVRTPRGPEDYNRADAREWGASNGFEVKPRGALAANLVEAFKAAGSPSAK